MYLLGGKAKWLATYCLSPRWGQSARVRSQVALQTCIGTEASLGHEAQAEQI